MAKQTGPAGTAPCEGVFPCLGELGPVICAEDISVVLNTRDACHRMPDSCNSAEMRLHAYGAPAGVQEAALGAA